MAGQGAPYEGPDHRWNPWGVTVWLQRLATFASRIPPPALALEFLGFRLYLPQPCTGWGFVRGRYVLVRVHLWRYDYWNQAYIFFSAALKRNTDPKGVAP